MPWLRFSLEGLTAYTYTNCTLWELGTYSLLFQNKKHDTSNIHCFQSWPLMWSVGKNMHPIMVCYRAVCTVLVINTLVSSFYASKYHSKIKRYKGSSTFARSLALSNCCRHILGAFIHAKHIHVLQICKMCTAFYGPIDCNKTVMIMIREYKWRLYLFKSAHYNSKEQ